jgi:predicted DCC family thiol-disulfide oxidoreductase YuxK
MTAEHKYCWPDRKIWRDLAGVDLRSLALFRVMLALALLVNATLYWPDATTFFADGSGLSPRAPLSRMSIYNWSVLGFSGAPWFLHLFFFIYVLASLGLFFGYRTRLMTLICWLCAVSLRNRGGMFISLADVQLGILLFWALFLPLGARFSVDAALRKVSPPGNHYATIASLALILNVGYLYFFGALEKTGYAWLQSHDAIYYALSNIETTTPLAPYALMLGAETLRHITQFVYYLELLGPALLFLPKFTGQGRLLVVPLFMLLHVSFVLFLSIGIFPLVSFAGLCALLPALFWDKPLAAFNRRRTRCGIVMFYDRGCDFCLKCCLIFRALGLPPSTQIQLAQDDAIAGPILERENSWVVKTHDGRYLAQWEAVAYIWRRSPLLFPLGVLFMLPGLKTLGRMLYAIIARHRPALAAFSARFLPFSEAPLYRPGLPAAAGIAMLALFVLTSNIYHVADIRAYGSSTIRSTLKTFGLTQRWKMYASPIRTSNWLVVEGTLVDGRKVDALHLNMHPPSHTRPGNGWEVFPHFRWRKYFSRVKWKKHGVRVVNYYCRRWEENHPDTPIHAINIYTYRQTTTPGKPAIVPEKKRVYGGTCPIAQ